MKPKAATITTVSLLLALSALCVGGRQYVDAQQEAARRRAAGSKTPASTPHVQPNEVIPEKVTRPASGNNRDWLAKQLRNALSTQDEAARTRALLELVSHFTGEDWLPALAEVEKMGIGKGYPGWAFILAAWTEASPVKALDWAIGTKASWTAGLQTWMARDPDATMAYITSRKDDEWGTAMALRRTAIEALENDLPRLGRFLAEIHQERAGAEAINVGSLKFENHTTEALKEWVATLDPGVKPQGFGMVMKTRQGFEEKSAWCREFPELAEPYQGSLYATWAKEDPAAASAALEKMEPGKMREAVVGGLIGGLHEKSDFAGVFELTRRYPEGISHGYLNDLINDALMEHPELAIAEIPRLEREDTQVWQYRMTLNRWLEKDPAAAKKWIEENEIPYQIRKELEGKLTRPLDGKGK